MTYLDVSCILKLSCIMEGILLLTCSHDLTSYHRNTTLPSERSLHSEMTKMWWGSKMILLLLFFLLLQYLFIFIIFLSGVYCKQVQSEQQMNSCWSHISDRHQKEIQIRFKKEVFDPNRPVRKMFSFHCFLIAVLKPVVFSSKGGCAVLLVLGTLGLVVFK